jgi:hypothetical protein
MTVYVYLNKDEKGIYWLRQGNKAMGPDLAINPSQAKSHKQAVAVSLQVLKQVTTSAADGDPDVITILRDEIEDRTYTIDGITPLEVSKTSNKESNGCLPIMIFLLGVPVSIYCLI